PMKSLISSLLVILCCSLAIAQTSANKKQQEKQAKEQAKREQKERDKREQAAYYARILTPPVETFPASADVAGRIVSEIVLSYGYTFAGYQPAQSVFGAETAQMAVFTMGLSFNETLNYGGRALKFLAFAFTDKGEGESVVTGNVG